jgi:hypothetical protein
MRAQSPTRSVSASLRRIDLPATGEVDVSCILLLDLPLAGRSFSAIFRGERVGVFHA